MATHSVLLGCICVAAMPVLATAFTPHCLSLARIGLRSSSTLTSLHRKQGSSVTLGLVGAKASLVQAIDAVTLLSRAVPPQTFEAQAPPLGTTLSLLATVGLAAYWWLVFVPSERR